MKKKTGFILGISAVCLLGLGAQVKAASENGAYVTIHHFSDWHEVHHQQMLQQRTSDSYENESMSDTASSVSSENAEGIDSEGSSSCPQGHAWCTEDHQGWTDANSAADPDTVPSCPQGHEWCDGNHQSRSSAQGQTHHNEDCQQSNDHHNSGRHHGRHH